MVIATAMWTGALRAPVAKARLGCGPLQARKERRAKRTGVVRAYPRSGPCQAASASAMWDVRDGPCPLLAEEAGHAEARAAQEVLGGRQQEWSHRQATSARWMVGG